MAVERFCHFTRQTIHRHEGGRTPVNRPVTTCIRHEFIPFSFFTSLFDPLVDRINREIYDLDYIIINFMTRYSNLYFFTLPDNQDLIPRTIPFRLILEEEKKLPLFAYFVQGKKKRSFIDPRNNDPALIALRVESRGKVAVVPPIGAYIGWADCTRGIDRWKARYRRDASIALWYGSVPLAILPSILTCAEGTNGPSRVGRSWKTGWRWVGH